MGAVEAERSCRTAGQKMRQPQHQPKQPRLARPWISKLWLGRTDTQSVCGGEGGEQLHHGVGIVVEQIVTCHLL